MIDVIRRCHGEVCTLLLVDVGAYIVVGGIGEIDRAEQLS
jgi:hypothetical protein